MNKPDTCRPCPLCDVGQGFVKDEGDPERAELVLIGEAPGKMEVQRERPFVGESGFLLRGDSPIGVLRHLPELAQLLADDKVLLMNTLRCQPPMNKQGRHYPTGETRETAERMCRQYDPPFKAKVVVLLGEAAQSVFLQESPQSVLGTQSGVVERDGRLYVRALHPAYVLRQPQTIDLLIANLRLALELLKGFRREEFTYYRGQVKYPECAIAQSDSTLKGTSDKET